MANKVLSWLQVAISLLTFAEQFSYLLKTAYPNTSMYELMSKSVILTVLKLHIATSYYNEFCDS